MGILGALARMGPWLPLARIADLPRRGRCGLGDSERAVPNRLACLLRANAGVSLRDVAPWRKDVSDSVRRALYCLCCGRFVMLCMLLLGWCGLWMERLSDNLRIPRSLRRGGSNVRISLFFEMGLRGDVRASCSFKESALWPVCLILLCLSFPVRRMCSLCQPSSCRCVDTSSHALSDVSVAVSILVLMLFCAGLIPTGWFCFMTPCSAHSIFPQSRPAPFPTPPTFFNLSDGTPTSEAALAALAPSPPSTAVGSTAAEAAADASAFMKVQRWVREASQCTTLVVIAPTEPITNREDYPGEDVPPPDAEEHRTAAAQRR